MSLATKGDAITGRIKDLPPLPLVVRKLLTVMEDDHSSAEDISAVLASDQALAAKILKLVNSSFYGLSGQVGTISRAVVILGVGAIRNLALGLSVAGVMGKGRGSSLWSRFWDHSLASATAAEFLARETQYPDPEEAFVAGLLHDVGHLVFMLAAPGDFCDLMEKPTGNILDREEASLGLTHTRCGQKLLKHWKLPRPLEQAVRFHHTGSVLTSGDDELVTIVGTADLLAGSLCGGFEGSPTLAEFTTMLKLTGLDVNRLGEHLDHLKGRLEEARTFLHIALESVSQENVGQENDDPDHSRKPETEPEPLEVAVVGDHPLRTAWTRQILEHWGNQPVPMKSFFSQAAQGRWPDLVILDGASVSDEQLGKMAPLLMQARGFLALLGREDQERVEAVLGGELPHLPLGFCQKDLLVLIDDQ